MRPPSLLSLALAGALLGVLPACRAPAPVTPAAASLPAMTFFGADDPDFPAIATALNERVRAKFPKSATVTHAPVSLEEAQIAVGCVEATAACWSAVAKSVDAATLLLAEVGAKKGGGVRVGVRLFDSRTRATLRVAERSMASAEQALAAVPLIVDELRAAAGK